MYDPDEEDAFTSYPWVEVSWRPVVTRRFLELEDPDRYLGPAVQVGSSCYDGPYGTSDHDGANHG